MTYFNESNKTKPYIKHGPLCENYLLEQIHFHWGSKDHTGSEHTVNGKIFSMEMHVVHYRQSAKSFEDALNVPSGVAVIAYFFEVSFEYIFKFSRKLFQFKLYIFRYQDSIILPYL